MQLKIKTKINDFIKEAFVEPKEPTPESESESDMILLRFPMKPTKRPEPKPKLNYDDIKFDKCDSPAHLIGDIDITNLASLLPDKQGHGNETWSTIS